MKEWLHIVAFVDSRPTPDGDWRIKSRVWVIDVYRTTKSRIELSPSLSPVDTIEIDAPYLLIMQAGLKFSVQVDRERDVDDPFRLRFPLPLRAPLHIHGIFNTPYIVTGKEQIE